MSRKHHRHLLVLGHWKLKDFLMLLGSLLVCLGCAGIGLLITIGITYIK